MENQSRGILEKVVDVTTNALYLTGNGLVKYSPEILAGSSGLFGLYSLNFIGSNENFHYLSIYPAISIIGIVASVPLDKFISKRYGKTPFWGP